MKELKLRFLAWLNHPSAPVFLLPAMEASESASLMAEWKAMTQCSILDPYYNRGVGGSVPLPDYDRFIQELLESVGRICHTMYLWGFPDIIGAYARLEPAGHMQTGWLTWYYKNCPSVIRGWRSSQQACIQFQDGQSVLHPEHFLNEEQMERFRSGKMRFVPGPTDVIEQPLNIGFIKKAEQTGHPCQKPEAVFDRLILMSTAHGEIVFDPMAGSGTTGACAVRLGRRAVLSDRNPEYIALMKKRLAGNYTC